MDYVISHLPVIFGAACIVAISAILYWVSLERAAKLKRQRALARKKAALQNKEEK